MATAEERMRVLKMIEEGKISAKEGARLLGALGKSDEQARRQRGTAEAGAEGGGRWLRLRVSDTRSGKTRVNLTIPIGLVNMGLAVGARFVPDVAELDVEEIRDALRSGLNGKILEVHDEEELVEIFVE
ncbi:MAG: hypothetical protein F4Y42_14355 [Caldilineaceae bacterium SB0664_bin_27]|uniref:YvlB/LiaX N-terminal domain-containing protein n=1 Tax=Caldilineaceae bacterium SB0664_bin_27 TaxID=2605260 RepID=A0A6B0YUA1_9CHLR|nr:hypothetical protein [Caldilineaceae bacterium SB0664_bin_27]